MVEIKGFRRKLHTFKAEHLNAAVGLTGPEASALAAEDVLITTAYEGILGSDPKIDAEMYRRRQLVGSSPAMRSANEKVRRWKLDD